MRRIWHPYTVWEEITAGMWRRVPAEEHEAFLQRAIAFTGDDKMYGSWMLKVLPAWPLSCENSLTDHGMNRRAWIGHAACCLAFACPEYIVREAWWLLTQQQRDKADRQANLAIAAFEDEHERKNSVIHYQMALPGIPGRDSGRSAISS